MYYERIAIIAAALGLATTLVHARNWHTEAHDPFHYTFSNDKTIDVDNINGTIQITGDNSNTIRVDGERIIHAIDQQAVDHAKRDVKLDVNEKDGIAQLYVNGPFRNNHSSEDHGFHYHYDDHDYEVEYNFTIKVPRDIALRLRTVNGEIKTADTRGKFDVSGVNGPVTMTEVAGYGSLTTVNGKTVVAFRENPTQPCEFKTVNGGIDASFPANLSANLHLKTLNGSAFTDFETTLALPTTAEAGQSHGKNIFRFGQGRDVRIGPGGPELSFETVNGSITIKKETR